MRSVVFVTPNGWEIGYDSVLSSTSFRVGQKVTFEEYGTFEIQSGCGKLVRGKERIQLRHPKPNRAK